MLTPEDAKALLCPFARTFAASPAVPGCRGPECALWRWKGVSTAHPLWMPAVKERAKETGENVPYPKAARWVADNAADLGMAPTHGHCGAGGAS